MRFQGNYHQLVAPMPFVCAGADHENCLLQSMKTVGLKYTILSICQTHTSLSHTHTHTFCAVGGLGVGVRVSVCVCVRVCVCVCVCVCGYANVLDKICHDIVRMYACAVSGNNTVQTLPVHVHT